MKIIQCTYFSNNFFSKYLSKIQIEHHYKFLSCRETMRLQKKSEKTMNELN